MDVLRDAVRGAVAASGQRQVARDIGMSATGLRAFLKGGEPFEATRKKLTAWYLRTAQERGEHTTSATAQAALAVLVEHLPEEKREEVVRRMLTELRERTEEAKMRPPGWLK